MDVSGLDIYVDYENLGNKSLDGVRFLTKNDSLKIFYSNCNNMEKRYLTQIFQSGCTFEIKKLIKPCNNALDFYIASDIGQTYGKGNNRISAIISNDKDFISVIHFWQTTEPKPKIVRANTIAKGILAAGLQDERTTQIRMLIKNFNFEDEYAAWKQKKKENEKYSLIFSNTPYEPIINLIKTWATSYEYSRRELYYNAVSLFGREDGRDIYRMYIAYLDSQNTIESKNQ